MQPGPTFAGSDRFQVKVQGAGGHAGMPHKTRDAVVAASVSCGVMRSGVLCSQFHGRLAPWHFSALVGWTSKGPQRQSGQGGKKPNGHSRHLPAAGSARPFFVSQAAAPMLHTCSPTCQPTCPLAAFSCAASCLPAELLQMAVVALQPLVSRETNPVEGGVVTVSRFNTGKWGFDQCLLLLGQGRWAWSGGGGSRGKARWLLGAGGLATGPCV